jgi:hypothetical protein
MGQILHGSPTTTHAIRTAIQRSGPGGAALDGLVRLKTRRSSLPSASTRCCRWMTASMLCRQRSHNDIIPIVYDISTSSPKPVDGVSQNPLDEVTFIYTFHRHCAARRQTAGMC